MKNIYAYLGLVLSLLLLAGFTSALTVTPSVNDTDNYYSPWPSNGVINIRATTVNATNVTANFSLLNSACGTGGILNLTLNTTGNFYGSCDVTTAAKTSQFQSYSIPVTAMNSTHNPAVAVATYTVVLYNSTIPPMRNDTCEAAGTATTNFSQIANFNTANFVYEITKNGSATCNNGLRLPWGSVFQKIVTVNFTTVNLSDASIGTKLQGIGGAVIPYISLPGQKGDSYISVNSSAFSQLDTNATVTLYGLPFTLLPAVRGPGNQTANTSSFTLGTPYTLLFDCTTICASNADPAGCAADCSANGNDFNMTIPNANITFAVSGFSQYNVTDNATPTITMTTPQASTTQSATYSFINVTVNGTRSQLDYINISIDGVLVKNWTNAQIFDSCYPVSTNWEVVTCTYNATGLAEGTRNISVITNDLGGASGNNATTSRLLYIDLSVPVVSVSSPTAGQNFNSTNVTLFFTVTDITDSAVNCSINLTNATAGGSSIIGVITSNNTQYTNNITGLSQGNYTWFLNCSDDLNRQTYSTMTSFIVDTTAPTVNLISPANAATFDSSTTPVHYYNVTDALSPTFNCTFRWGGTSPGSSNFTGVANGTTLSASYLQGVLNENITWNISCYDNAAKLGTSSTWRYLINDTTAPAMLTASPNGSVSSGTSVAISVQTNESASCRYSDTDVAYASMTNNFTDDVTNHNATVTTTAGTGYTYYIRCIDVSSNVDTVSTMINFQVEAAASSSSGGGGGSAGFTPDPILQSKEQTMTLSTLNSYYFKLPGEKVSMQSHTLRISEIKSDGVLFNIRSKPIDVFVKLGETKDIDITGDGIADITIRVDSLTTKNVKFTIATPGAMVPTPAEKPKETTPAATPTETTTQTTSESTPEANTPSTTTGTEPKAAEEKDDKKTADNSWIWIGLIVIVAIIIIVLAISMIGKKPKNRE